MGNEAMGLGAIHAGVNLVAGYPGTPSTEILETVAKNNDGSIHVEWSVNEKAAMEVAAGAAYSGARALVTMKQVGLNVATDPLMSLAYVGVKGGLVIVSADDPGPISSQTEQDTRTFAMFSKIPVFDPSDPQEAYDMIKDAFELSEKIGSPVLFRPTTRVCHGCASIDVADSYKKNVPEGFVKDTMRWVIFPRTSFLNHEKIEKRNPALGEELSDYKFNSVVKRNGKKGIASGGVSWAYLNEAVSQLGDDKFNDTSLFRVATPFPFPEKAALKFLDGLDEVLCLEELDPVIERALIFTAGKYHLKTKIYGKLDGTTAAAGENSPESVIRYVSSFLGIENLKAGELPEKPKTPVRPPVLCAGCPHRASFYAVKQAMKGRKAVFCGDIGCYTLGNAMPLDMVDTCLCMGADVTIAQGIRAIDKDTTAFSFIGDSTFFASGITGVINAVYNHNDIVLIVLDNSTTAMTGHQPHPGTGITMMDFFEKRKQGIREDIANAVSIENILRGIGLSFVETVDPFDQKKAIDTVKKAACEPGVKAVIFKAPCIALEKPKRAYSVDTDKCIGCRKCITEIGCPAISMNEGKAEIEKSLCYGCSLCETICPVGAIGVKGGADD
ncbi:MAG: indolepyruvate ferredoxin oxidoreductase subunit alpha [Lachnospiraceae bacterium]|uniref:Indolepyruvate oxidoreductase subunit IorA n=1 Tax=Candidatus Weimeria bifida TaxID=2599074 RepID=A0A6N7IXS6_9FIRM|nr:indolepyruvate ferredoxin oxidoreductase subunit alpha [Candidatus Weimeria bifida]RRF95444.1 MAG: indolepyruvate ferredoxin oxidoreductase subunit alpha [Lachnospiraceae bacterium]